MRVLVERATKAAAPTSLQFRPGTNATGNMYLHSQGIQLSLVERKGANSSLQGGDSFEIEVINCLACKEGMPTWPACAKPVSLYARLVGPNNILRFVDVIPVDNFERGGDAGARRFRIFGTVPFVPGEYELEIKVRWFNGLAEIHHEGESPRPIFLGSEGGRSITTRVG